MQPSYHGNGCLILLTIFLFVFIIPVIYTVYCICMETHEIHHKKSLRCQISILCLVMIISALQDESLLIWLSSGGEKSLKLASISKIIPGQRTVSPSL